MALNSPRNRKKFRPSKKQEQQKLRARLKVRAAVLSIDKAIENTKRQGLSLANIIRGEITLMEQSAQAHKALARATKKAAGLDNVAKKAVDYCNEAIFDLEQLGQEENFRRQLLKQKPNLQTISRLERELKESQAVEKGVKRNFGENTRMAKVQSLVSTIIEMELVEMRENAAFLAKERLGQNAPKETSEYIAAAEEKFKRLSQQAAAIVKQLGY